MVSRTHGLYKIVTGLGMVKTSAYSMNNNKMYKILKLLLIDALFPYLLRVKPL